MKLLESLTDKEYVMELIEDLSAPITFNLSKSDIHLISLRNRINRRLQKAAG